MQGLLYISLGRKINVRYKRIFLGEETMFILILYDVFFCFARGITNICCLFR